MMSLWQLPQNAEGVHSCYQSFPCCITVPTATRNELMLVIISVLVLSPLLVSSLLCSSVAYTCSVFRLWLVVCKSPVDSLSHCEVFSCIKSKLHILSGMFHIFMLPGFDCCLFFRLWLWIMIMDYPRFLPPTCVIKPKLISFGSQINPHIIVVGI